MIVITGKASVNLAVEAMKEGAFDFVMKPLSAERMRVTVRNAIERRRLTNEIAEFQDAFGRDGFVDFMGNSLAMQAIYRILQSAAPTNATVFITGESGTGKELAATTIHKLSKRRNGPFVAINCAAIPKDLLESEIFGHVKGAFTGATTDPRAPPAPHITGRCFLIKSPKWIFRYSPKCCGSSRKKVSSVSARYRKAGRCPHRLRDRNP